MGLRGRLQARSGNAPRFATSDIGRVATSARPVSINASQGLETERSKPGQ